MQRLITPLFALLLFFCSSALAQQQQTFGEYEVHYNAFNSSMLSIKVAKAYGIQRTDSRAVINITVLKRNDEGTTDAMKAKVTVSGRNLIGQTREVDMREINENNEAIYYIGELSVRNQEMYDFTALVTPEGRNEPLTVKFRQQFYTQ